MKTKTEKKYVPGPDCFVCERGGTNMQYIGNGMYRHHECAPGSRNWCEWYDAHPEMHSDAGNILRAQHA